MAQEQHRATVRDYLLAVRRRKLVILGTALIAAAVAVGLTATKAKNYSASASLQARNLQELSGLVGLLQSNQELPQQTAAQLAQTATRTEILTAVRRRLRLRASVPALRSDLSITQDQTSNLVQITGTAGTAQGAAALTNAVADEVASTSNEEMAHELTALSTSVAREARRISLAVPNQYGKLSASQKVEVQGEAQRAHTLADVSARLAALGKVAESTGIVDVTDRATPPGGPSSPHPVQNGIIGGIVGLLLGGLAAWFLESMDRRLRRPDEARELLGLPFVGAIENGVLGGVPGTDGAKGAGTLAAFRMLRTNVGFLSSDGSPKSVLVTSGLPEEGKTTVALGLALAAAASGMRTLLIEADVHRAVHAERLGLRAGPGLMDYLRDGIDPREVVQTYTLSEPGAPPDGNGASPARATLACITAGTGAPGGAHQIGSEAFRRVLAEVREVYEFVVVDSAPLLAIPETSQLVPIVDAVVMCLRLGQTTTEQARATRDAFERLPYRLAGSVFTDVPSDRGDYYGYGPYAYAYASSHKPAASAA